MRPSLAVVLGLLLVAVPLVGCIGSQGGDEIDRTNATPTEENEAPELPEELTQLSPLTTVETDGGGTGVWIDEARDLLLSANGGAGLQILDISSPDQAEVVGQVDDVYARDVDMMDLGDRQLAVLAAGDGINVVDVTDPSEPEHLTKADAYDSHNVAVVPGTTYVYDSTAIGAEQKVQDPVVPVLDLANPSDPSWTTFEIPATVNGQPVQSDGCHDVVVRPDLGQAFCAGGGGFYVAGGGETFIWDISEDPADPAWVGVVDNPSIVYHHQALASDDGALLFINDEHIAPNCRNVGTPDPAPDVKQWTAAMWIYDISDPSSPEMLSYVQAPEEQPNANCGSHFGDRVDGRDAVVWGWYQGGTLLIDVSDPANPAIVDKRDPVGSTWDARYHEGHVYASSGDVQVFEIT